MRRAPLSKEGLGIESIHRAEGGAARIRQSTEGALVSLAGGVNGNGGAPD